MSLEGCPPVHSVLTPLSGIGASECSQDYPLFLMPLLCPPTTRTYGHRFYSATIDRIPLFFSAKTSSKSTSRGRSSRNVPFDAMMLPADVNFDPGRGDWGSGIIQRSGLVLSRFSYRTQLYRPFFNGTWEPPSTPCPRMNWHGGA